MYADVSVIVDGALEEDERFHDYMLLDAFVSVIEEDQKDHGYPVEVYILEHDHEEPNGDEECACAQYLQDHRPSYTFATV